MKTNISMFKTCVYSVNKAFILVQQHCFWYKIHEQKWQTDRFVSSLIS